MAATFNRTLLYLAGRGAGSMLRAENNEGHPQDNASRLSCWSPMMNIARHPLWGRNHEGYGECPYVPGRTRRWEEYVCVYVPGRREDGRRMCVYVVRVRAVERADE